LRFETNVLAIKKDLIQVEQQISQTLGVEKHADVTAAPNYREIVIGQDERVKASFLEKGLFAARSVARIEVRRADGAICFGTGWLIAPQLLITNHHVIAADGMGSDSELEWNAKHSIARFGYNTDTSAYEEYNCETLLYANAHLDFAVVRLAESSSSSTPIRLTAWGFLRLVQGNPQLKPGARLNVIQHPKGRPKEFALRSNYHMGIAEQETLLHYLSDTEPGSSGSPVFNDYFFVVGLHRGWNDYSKFYQAQPIQFKNLGVQYQPPNSQTNDIVATVNEGVMVNAILNALPTALQEEIAHAQGWN
jgi:V8-like Glu-specific endopeptidase